MFEIEVVNDFNHAVNTPRLRKAVGTVLSAHSVPPGSSLSVVITDNDTVKALNSQYRGIDAPTDILSFPADAPPVDIPGEAPYLGDLIIAYAYASAQAEREGHALDDSLDLLVVHGTLHLLGYDHDTAESRAVMWTAQEKALRALDISPAIVPVMEGDTNDHDRQI